MTALRELAERWKRHADHGGAVEYLQCCNELLAILDAEGDGGAVPIGYACPRSIQGYTLGQYGDFRVSDKSSLRSVPIFDNPHPVRSGVVREVEKTINALLKEIGESDRHSRIHVSTVLFHIKKLQASIKSQEESNV